MSHIYVLAKDLRRLHRLAIRDCYFSKAVAEAEEILSIEHESATNLFPELKFLTITNGYDEDYWPLLCPGVKLTPPSVILFFLIAANDVRRLQLDQEALGEDAANCVRRAVEKGCLKNLEELVTRTT